MIFHSWDGLVVLTILKHMKVNGKDYPIYEMDNKKCLKPPTSIASVTWHTKEKGPVINLPIQHSDFQWLS